MAYNNESFCPEAWSQLEITSVGDYSICCLANNDTDFGIAYDVNGKPMNVMTHSFEEALNSETHKAHRLQLSRNEKPVRCRNCYDNEEATRGDPRFGIDTMLAGRSKRQRVITGTGASIPIYVKADTADQCTNPATGETTSRIANLHLRFGNLCNMKCIMCSPQHSSLWYDDHVAFGFRGYDGSPIYKLGKNRTFKIVKDEHGRNRINFPQWWESDIWWERFRGVMPDLKYIYFTGGEPFLVPAMLKCLDMLIEADLARDIKLRFDTNLSVINSRILDKLDKFKRVIMCVSIDDVEERYNFIRFPGEFSTFVTNLERLKKTNITIEYLSSCIGIASIYTMPRVCDFAEQHGIRPEFRYLEGPHWLDLRYLPSSAKREMIARYQEFGQAKPQHEQWYAAIIRLLNKYMAEDNTNYDKLNDFVKYMDILDQQRGTDWRTTLPDTYDLLKRHCPDLVNL